MANKLAGQRAKFTKAFADYNRTDDDDLKLGPARRMAEVIRQAPANGFSEAEVTGGRDLPDGLRRLALQQDSQVDLINEDSEQLVRSLVEMVDGSDLLEVGVGDQYVYAYGYRCAPGRLKVGRTEKDVLDRITQQIGTSTPDRPTLFLILRTANCRALEMAIHGTLRLRERRVVGGGTEWFQTNREELLMIYRVINEALPQ